MLVTFISHLLVLAECADRTSEETVIRAVLKVFQKGIGIDRPVAIDVLQ